MDRSFEVLEVVSPTRVPGAPPPIQGVIAHRGEVVPLVDLETLVPIPGAEPGVSHRALLLRTSGGPLALSLSEVRGLEELPAEPRAGNSSELGGALREAPPDEENRLWVVDPERLYTFLCRL